MSNYKSYKQKLEDPRWQKKRLKIMERDDFTCIRCGNDQIQLHVHHTEYIRGRDPWEYADKFLETLCHVCHLKEHSTAIEEVKNVIDYKDQHNNKLFGEIVPEYTHQEVPLVRPTQNIYSNGKQKKSLLDALRDKHLVDNFKLTDQNLKESVNRFISDLLFDGYVNEANMLSSSKIEIISRNYFEIFVRKEEDRNVIDEIKYRLLDFLKEYLKTKHIVFSISLIKT